MGANISSLPGIYIHIPFCRQKCGYCDFYSSTDTQYSEEFVNALVKEIYLTAAQDDYSRPFDTIYFGGGTPSLLKQSQLEKILAALQKSFSFSENTETTLEANPGTITSENLADFFRMGINRLSIGIQSFNNKDLQFLERIHSADEARASIDAARSAGYNNLSLDLICAVPGQSADSWKQSLSEAISFKPEHLSIYSLMFEKGTPFYSRMLKGEISARSQEDELAFLELTVDMLKENGFIPYEVSNYAASPELYSRHNYKYWTLADYLGFGPSAHSFRNGIRRANSGSLNEYISSLNEDRIPVSFTETIDAETAEYEYIFLSLRTYKGLDTEQFYNRFGLDFYEAYKEITNALISEDLARQEKQLFQLTQKGMFICDEILAKFIKT